MQSAAAPLSGKATASSFHATITPPLEGFEENVTRRTLIKTILPLCLLLTIAGAAAAQETVCDGQHGAAYGLCTAFCEAMDCDSDDPQASQTACDKVGAKFLTITGQAPPCAVPTCPCVGGLSGFSEAINGEFGGLTSCQQSLFPALDIDSVTLTTGDGQRPSTQASAASNLCGFPGSDALFLSHDQALACSALLRAKAVAAGLTCVPF